MATRGPKWAAWSWGSREGSAVAGGEHWEVTLRGLGLAGAGGAAREPRPRGVTGGQPLKQGSRGLNLAAPTAWSPGLCPQGNHWGLRGREPAQHRVPLSAALPGGRPGHPAPAPRPGSQGQECRAPRAWRGSTRHLGASRASGGAPLWWEPGPRGSGSGGGAVSRGVSAAPRRVWGQRAGLGPPCPKPPEDGAATPLRATRGSPWRGAPAPGSLCGKAGRGHQMAPGAR